ncbi:MAG: 3-deoxy-manno-octulosonate cytidylyltransferase [Bdellovibrionota bacterium]
MSYIVVPLRLQSQRLPEKILADVGGKALCVRSLERVFASVALTRAPKSWTVIAAVDDAKTEKLLKKHFPELRVILTDPALPSGTDRVHAGVASLGSAKDDNLVINVQGDMPCMSPRHTAEFLDWCVDRKPAFGTLAHAWPRDQDLEDRAHVKALVAQTGKAIYFSRFQLPYSRVEAPSDGPLVPWYHVGIYAYTYRQLSAFCAWPPSPLERFEGLEQLRALDRGVAIDVMTFENTDTKHSFRGVDTPADLEWARSQK